MELFQGFKSLQVEKRDKIVVVTFNNPKKKNSINIEGYKEITRILNEVNQDDEVTIIVFTGAGDYYTSGNDLNMSFGGDIETFLKESNKIFVAMITAFINCKKIIFSLVNGPCIGIGASLAGLSDVVWCAEHAYFLMPFSKLGIVPEGCSSYLLPLIVGRSRASEMLLLSEPLNAQEAYQFNFVSRVFKLEDLDSVIWPKIRAFSELPPGSLQASKKLLRMHQHEILLNTNKLESDELFKRFFTEEFSTALVNFSTRKNGSKL